jgi:hypothetical protein
VFFEKPEIRVELGELVRAPARIFKQVEEQSLRPTLHVERNMERKSSGGRLALASLILSMVLGVTAGTALADSQNTDVVPPQQLVEGLTYGQWSEAWWQWMLAIPFGPNLPNPTGYSDGTHCNVNQSGPIWFLTAPAAGSMNGTTEQCLVPQGKYIFLPILNAECSTYEQPAGIYPSSQFGPGCTDEASCKACAKTSADLIARGSLSALVDGVPVTDLQSPSSPFRVQSPDFFPFSVPTNNFFSGEGLRGAGSGNSEADGYWLMIKPLPLGSHTIQFKGNFVLHGKVLFGENVTYNITVTQP